MSTEGSIRRFTPWAGDVLDCIRRHPEGITAADIGIETGLDSHHVVSAVMRLSQTGLIHKIGARANWSKLWGPKR